MELLQLVTSPAPADGQPGQPVSQQWLEAAMMTRKPSIVRNPALHTPPQASVAGFARGQKQRQRSISTSSRLTGTLKEESKKE